MVRKVFAYFVIIAVIGCLGYFLGSENIFSHRAAYLSSRNLKQALYRINGDSTSEEEDQISNSRQNAITRTVKMVSPAVVGITVTEVQEYRNPLSDFFGNDPFFRQFFGNQNYTQEIKGLGSGVIISPDGYILTNDHVAGNAKQITVTLTSGEKYSAKLVGSDEVSDVALLKINGKDFPYAKLGNSDGVLIGEWVVAFGNPFGMFENIDKPIVTVGVVSSKGMNLTMDNGRSYRGLIQTDAVINEGNSGGPLVDADGEVIGINTLIYTAGVSQAYIGYGFAIPINHVRTVAEELEKEGKVERNFWTGLEIDAVDPRIARYFGLDKAQGAIITDVKKGSPAEKIGLKPGDIIVDVDDQKILTPDDVVSILEDLHVGDTVKLKIYRDRKYFTADLVLEKKSESTSGE
jgi:serine protease Do